MNLQNNFQQIEHKDSKAVVSFSNGTTFRINHFMGRLNDFFIQNVLVSLSEKLQQAGLGTPPNHQRTWNDSVDAEILEPHSGEWKKGKIRMRVILEFCPDEPEEINNDILQPDNNSLDDIRKTIS